MNKIGKLIKEVIFPSSYTCDICGIETFGTNICPDCLKDVTFNDKSVCPVCGRKTALNELCMECKAQPPLFKRAVSAFVYEKNVLPLIYKFKNGNGYLKDYFADCICKRMPFECDCITFVPMTKKALRKRGYNQAQLLAQSISERINIPVIDVLEKVKDTSEQKSLSQKERAENLKGSFKVTDRAAVKNKVILLVDDILTTGATADAVCAKLLSAGAKEIYFATVASVQYQNK